jgi:hypothetical protein
MTLTITLWPLIKALMQAAVFISNTNKIPDNWHTQWQTTNDTQQLFVQKYLAQFKEIEHFKPDELKAWASKNYQELNDILAKEHFAIRLDPFPAHSFGVVAILDVMMAWRSPGNSKKITAKNTNVSYSAAQIEHGFTVFTSPHHAHPIACIQTKSGETAWFTIADAPKNDFALLQHIDSIKKNLQSDENYQSVIFPKIDLDQQPDISWLLRMAYAGYFIAQAKQQTKLKMNELGAHVQSAAAIAMMRSMPPSDKKVLVIDQPFLFWIEKPDVSIPVFAGYLDTDVWKDPGTLSMEPNKQPSSPSETPPSQIKSSWWTQIKESIQTWWYMIMNFFKK